jgi:hypothetical protein
MPMNNLLLRALALIILIFTCHSTNCQTSSQQILGCCIMAKWTGKDDLSIHFDSPSTYQISKSYTIKFTQGLFAQLTVTDSCSQYDLMSYSRKMNKYTFKSPLSEISAIAQPSSNREVWSSTHLDAGCYMRQYTLNKTDSNSPISLIEYQIINGQVSQDPAGIQLYFRNGELTYIRFSIFGKAWFSAHLKKSGKLSTISVRALDNSVFNRYKIRNSRFVNVQ